MPTVTHLLAGAVLVLASTSCSDIVPAIVSSSPSQCPSPITIQSNTLPLQIKWQYDAGETILFLPHAAAGMVFIKTAEPPCFHSIYTQAKLVALNAATGQKLWESAFIGLVDDVGPLVFQDLVIFPVNAEKSLRAVNMDTGQTVWEIGPKQNGDDFRIIAEDDQYIYGGGGIDQSTLYAIAPRTGTVVWEQSSELPTRYLSGLIVTNGKLYAFFTKGLYVLDPKVGQVIQHSSAGLSAMDNPSYQDHLAFLAVGDRIRSVDLDSGELRWQFIPECVQGTVSFWDSPTPIADTLYVTEGCRTIFTLNPETGQPKWQYDGRGAQAVAPFVLFQGLGYAMFSDGSVRAIDLASHQDQGALATDMNKKSWYAKGEGFAALDDMLYITFGDSRLYAFGK